jgi:hypothetical protein
MCSERRKPLVAAKDGWGMQAWSEVISLQKLGRGLLAPCAIAVLIGGVARAEDLDQGKSAAKLFADGCAECHHSARGLAKGRISLTLFMFLQKHYTSSSSSAWALTSYLESADSPQRGRARAAATKQSPSASPSSPRPPAPVPGR